MTVTSGDISDSRPKPRISGLWHGPLPKLELSIPGFSTNSVPVFGATVGLAGAVVRPPFQSRWFGGPGGRPMLPIYSLLAMSAETGSRGISVDGGTGGADGSTKPNLGVSRGRAGTNRSQPASGTEKAEEAPREADPDELHNLVVEHGDAIYRLALSVVRDQALAEDVAQEALVKAWLALPTFRGDASLRSWLLRITHNTAISTLRRRRAVVVDPQEMPEQPSRIERSVESRVQAEVVMDDFVAALDTLDELSRSIVVLRELEGLSYDEISEVLGVPMPTVKTRLLRARRRLSNVLREWA